MSKIISHDKDAKAWLIPEISDTRGQAGQNKQRDDGLSERERRIVERELKKLKQTAYQEGFDKGQADGLAAAQGQINSTVHSLTAVLGGLAEPLQHMDANVESELVNLAVSIARQIVRRELKTDPGQVVAVVRESLSIIPAASQHVRVYLNPEDVQLVRQIIPPAAGERAWEVIDDPVLSRGSCRVETETTVVDATLESRIAAIAAKFLAANALMTDQDNVVIFPDMSARLARHSEALEEKIPLSITGKLIRMVGLTLEVVGIQAAIGGRCLVMPPEGAPVEAEVVGFAGDKTYLMPTGSIHGLVPNAKVMPTNNVCEAPAGMGLLGRVLDGAGRPLDNLGELDIEARVPLSGRFINPLARHPIDTPLDVGVAAINAMLTVGRGQRMGLFAGSGVGKSVLLGMMTKYTTADVIVVGLIGERGREVKEFIENILGPEGMARSVVVASPADNSPLMRLHGAMQATSIAEYFRDCGLQVLLLMDSLTRFAQAQREIALAIGEPPATKGYPPSVFAKLPQLVERAGNGDKGGGSITAFYTVLVEGDDQQDPIADAARAILDGHIVLSRDLAEMGHYPAVDIEASISRVMNEIVPPEYMESVRYLKQLYSTYEKNRDLISVGAYSEGSDPKIDEAIHYYPQIMNFLSQNIGEAVQLEESQTGLAALLDYPMQTDGRNA